MSVPLVISCEHASNRVPAGVDLGVTAAVLDSHVAWDHGAKEIAGALASRFGAPLFLGEWTRLFVDLNRFPASATVIPAVAFGTPVPGNVGLSAAERACRLEGHAAWRASVASAVSAAIARCGSCVHLSIHSFTPELGGEVRDYDMGILFDPERTLDRRVADSLLVGLRSAGLSSRANEPYAGVGDGMTSALRLLHGEHLYAGIEVETSHRVTMRFGGIEAVSSAVGAAVTRWTSLA